MSHDQKTVKWQISDFHFKEEMANSYTVGSEGFTSGRHYWEVEVEVGQGVYIYLGVVRESVKRRRVFMCSPEEGAWGVNPLSSSCQTLTFSVTNMLLPWRSKKIGGFLDCEERQVAFGNAHTKAEIFPFP